MNKTITYILLTLIIISCNKGPYSDFPMEKRYWTPEDYDKVIRAIHFTTPEGQRFPELKNPESSEVFKKLVNHDNFLVILEDNSLGIQHRSKVAQEFFNEYRDLSDAYFKVDRQDKFIYGKELVKILNFGLDLQIHYFKLGNEQILQEADDPNNRDTKSTIRSNENTILKNFNNYLDLVNKESYLSDEDLNSYADGIDLYFPKVFEAFPNANRSITIKKAELMLKKATHEKVKSSLENLLNNLKG